MKVLLKKYGKGFFPATSEDMDKCSKYNGLLEVTIKDGRNLQFHRKLFALFKLGFDSQSFYTNFSFYRFRVLINIERCKEVPRVDGGIDYMPISLSFDKMSQSEAEDVYKDLLDYLVSTLDTDQKTILNNLINFM